MSNLSNDHGPEARKSTAFATSVAKTSVTQRQVEEGGRKGFGTFCDAIATQWIELPNLVSSAALARVLEDRSRHARLDESRTEGVDSDVSALELPCGGLRDRVYAE